MIAARPKKRKAAIENVLVSVLTTTILVHIEHGSSLASTILPTKQINCTQQFFVIWLKLDNTDLVLKPPVKSIFCYQIKEILSSQGLIIDVWISVTIMITEFHVSVSATGDRIDFVGESMISQVDVCKLTIVTELFVVASHYTVIEDAAVFAYSDERQRYRMRRSADVVAGDELAAGTQISLGEGHARLVGPVAGEGLLRKGCAVLNLAVRFRGEKVDPGDA